MNIKRLGVPVYKNKHGQEYVLPSDLKLALDSDTYERIVSKTAKFVADNGHTGFDLAWLEMQY